MLDFPYCKTVMLLERLTTMSLVEPQGEFMRRLNSFAVLPFPLCNPIPV